MDKKKLLTLLFSQLMALTAAADKVYISDFSIKAGETKQIAVNLDSDRSDLKQLTGTITMPAGLTVMNQGTGSNALWMTPDATRTNGAIAQYNSATGEAAIFSFGSTFNAGTGAIAYISVTASTDLAETSTIAISGFQAKTSGNTVVDLTTADCTVTREAGQGGGDTPTPVDNSLSFAFSPASLTMTAGEVKQVEVQMTNGMTATGLQATLTASTGLTIQSVTKGSRMSGWNYNAANGRIFALGAISGNEGTVFTVSLKAGDDFSGSATLKATGLAVTDNGAHSYQAADITLPVTVQSQASVTMGFGSEKVYLKPGESAAVDVTLDSEADLTGFMGTLTLPDGITATVAKGAIVSSAPQYNATTGAIIYLGGVSAREGVLFTLTLTADDTFTADGDVTFTNISTSTASAQSIVPADITLPAVALAPVTGVTVEALLTTATVSWEGSADSYKVRYRTAAVESPAVPAGEWQEVETGDTQAELTGLTMGTGYEYTVTGIKDSHEGAATETATFTTLEGIELAEDADNTALLAENEGRENIAVQMTRTLQAGGYNTFAAPFAISGEKLTELGITAKQLTASAFNGETGELSLTFADAKEIEAGKPYLVKVTDAVVNPLFEGVTVSSTATETDAVDFVPTLGATAITDDVKKILFLSSGNKLYRPADADSQQMKGFRAYFRLKGDATAARNFRMDFDKGETTGIIAIGNGDGATADSCYDLSGRKVARPANGRMSKGMYIVNGKKVVIK